MGKYIFVALVSILLLLSAGFAIKQYQDNKALQSLIEQKNEKLMEADLEIGRAETKLLEEKELHRLTKDKVAKLDKQISEEIKKRNAVITEYGELTARYNKVVKKVRTLTEILTTSTTQPVIVEIPAGKLFYKNDKGELQQVKSLKYSYKDFRIDISGDVIKQELNYNLHQRFRVHLIQTKLPTGAKNHYVKLYELDDKGEQVTELKVEEFQVLSSNMKKSSHFYWWKPQLDLGVVGDISLLDASGFITGELGFSLSAYGDGESEDLIRFLRLSVGGSADGFTLGVSPIQWNLGKQLPLVKNLWLYPRVGYTFTKGSSIGVGLSVVF